jgi:hypothetical protein
MEGQVTFGQTQQKGFLLTLLTLLTLINLLTLIIMMITLMTVMITPTTDVLTAIATSMRPPPSPSPDKTSTVCANAIP